MAGVRHIGEAVTRAIHAVPFDEIDALETVRMSGGAVIVAPNNSLSQRLSEADLAMRYARSRELDDRRMRRCGLYRGFAEGRCICHRFADPSGA
jgi:hypothetical protein